MRDFFQALQDAFPSLRNHGILMARLTIAGIGVVALYMAKGLRRRVFLPLGSRLHERIFATNRWLRVYQVSNDMAQWKYYTSEVTGRGQTGDDIVWSLVHWPSLRPKDSFRVHGAVGMVEGIRESQAKLHARWQIVHDPDGAFIGPGPARGLRSAMRRIGAKICEILGASF